MLGSNPSAGSGTKTEARAARRRPDFPLRDWYQCDKPNRAITRHIIAIDNATNIPIHAEPKQVDASAVSSAVSLFGELIIF